MYQRKGKWDEAIEEYNKALSIQPDFTKALVKLAKVYVIKKQYDMAISLFEKVIGLRPDGARGYYNIAPIYAKQNKTEESVDWLRMAMDKGFKGWNLIKKDKDLENIRGSLYYQELIRGH